VIYELNHVGGRVQDLDASLAFYAGLGAEVVDRLFMPNNRVHRVHIQLATGLIELLYHEESDPNATYGLNHVGFMTDDLDGDYARLIALGYAELSAPKVAGSGQGRLAFLADPNGTRIELLQRSEEFRIPPITSGPVSKLAFIGLDAPALDAATEFYGTHLGMERDTTADSPGAASFRIGDDAVKVADSLPSATTPINHLGVVTTDPRPDTHDPDGVRVTFVRA
jgi:catechol 2,3-dioxygenase-like lactoylglutathione lyase family enzyme